jgi:hypothetical protein
VVPAVPRVFLHGARRAVPATSARLPARTGGGRRVSDDQLHVYLPFGFLLLLILIIALRSLG